MKAGHNGVVETEGNTIVISQLGPELQEYTTVPGLVSLVKTGDKVFRGQALAEGPLNLQDIMDSIGVDAVYQYIVTQLNEIYVSNGITVNEKHIELIVRQMCNRVQVIDQGEGELSLGDLVSLSLVQSMNKKLEAEGKKIIIYKRIVIGISRASLATESWLSAASFQETAKVLVEAVISGRKDQLLGLKENVILGQLIPAGTGFDGVKAITTEIQEEFEEEISPDLEESMVEV
jgi:DNA-directed RNA polymerase subunit beta'